VSERQWKDVAESHQYRCGACGERHESGDALSRHLKRCAAAARGRALMEFLYGCAERRKGKAVEA